VLKCVLCPILHTLFCYVDIFERCCRDDGVVLAHTSVASKADGASHIAPWKHTIY